MRRRVAPERMLVWSWYRTRGREERVYERLRDLVVVRVHFDQAFVRAKDVARHLVEEDGDAQRCGGCFCAIAFRVVLRDFGKLGEEGLCGRCGELRRAKCIEHVEEVVAACLVEGESLVWCAHEPSAHDIHVDFLAIGIYAAKPDVLDSLIECWGEDGLV